MTVLHPGVVWRDMDRGGVIWGIESPFLEIYVLWEAVYTRWCSRNHCYPSTQCTSYEKQFKRWFYNNHRPRNLCLRNNLSSMVFLEPLLPVHEIYVLWKTVWSQWFSQRPAILSHKALVNKIWRLRCVSLQVRKVFRWSPGKSNISQFQLRPFIDWSLTPEKRTYGKIQGSWCLQGTLTMAVVILYCDVTRRGYNHYWKLIIHLCFICLFIYLFCEGFPFIDSSFI